MKINGVSVCEPDCPDRQMGCHGKCEKYRAFRNGRLAAHEEKLKQYKITEYSTEAVRRAKEGHSGMGRYRPK